MEESKDVPENPVPEKKGFLSGVLGFIGINIEAKEAKQEPKLDLVEDYNSCEEVDSDDLSGELNLSEDECDAREAIRA